MCDGTQHEDQSVWDMLSSDGSIDSDALAEPGYTENEPPTLSQHNINELTKLAETAGNMREMLIKMVSNVIQKLENGSASTQSGLPEDPNGPINCDPEKVVNPVSGNPCSKCGRQLRGKELLQQVSHFQPEEWHLASCKNCGSTGSDRVKYLKETEQRSTESNS